MNTREKRTQTEPGLGQSAGDSRPPTPPRDKRRATQPPPARPAAIDRVEPASVPPSSGPPTSAPPTSGGGRHTKALEQPRRTSRERISTGAPGVPSQTPVPPSAPRGPESSRALSRDEEGGQSGLEDTPFDRLDRLDRIRRAPTLREEGTETPRAAAVASTPPASRRLQRPIEGRPVSYRPSAEPRPLSSKPPASGRGGVRPSVRPPKPSAPPPGSNRPAKSQRASIRIDDVGSVGQDALGRESGAGAIRRVPKLLKTKDEIAAAPIDNRAGFLLTYIDGSTSVQGLVDMAVMPEEEVHEILDRLRRLGIIALR